MPTTGEAAQEPCTLQKDSEPEKTLALKGLAIIIPTHDTHKHKSHLQPEMADICKMNTIELLTAELIGALDNILQTKKRITAQQTKGQDTSQDTWEELAECKEIWEQNCPEIIATTNVVVQTDLCPRLKHTGTHPAHHIRHGSPIFVDPVLLGWKDRSTVSDNHSGHKPETYVAEIILVSGKPNIINCP